MVKNKSEKIAPTARIGEIDGNTHIIFSIKMFFSFLGGLLGIFFGFNQLVIAPKINDSTIKYEKLSNEVNKHLSDQDVLINSEFRDINNSIIGLKNSVDNHIQNTNGKKVISYEDVINDRIYHIKDSLNGTIFNPENYSAFETPTANNIKK